MRQAAESEQSDLSTIAQPKTKAEIEIESARQESIKQSGPIPVVDSTHIISGLPLADTDEANPDTRSAATPPKVQTSETAQDSTNTNSPAPKLLKIGTVSEEMVSDLLGPKRFVSDMAARKSEPGIATGLAWTQVGGDILFIEAVRIPGKGGTVLTGQLGDVMKESAQAAMSYIRSNAKALGVDENFLDKHDIHIHIPAGSIPKDGPSAGVTLFLALLSLLTKKGVPPDMALTGEITLRGAVLPVGGIKEKVLAAHRAGIKTIIIPARNEKDLIDVPKQAKDELSFQMVKRVDQLIPLLTTLPS